MEAENFLSGGYGERLAMQAPKLRAWRISDIASVWQPSRLKGIQVSREFGTPFLAATQVFDLRPVPRKFLSLDRTDNASGRFVHSGDVLVTCSGNVGRVTLAHAPHLETLISHDLLRVNPKDPALWGWIYAFLRSRQARAMMNAAQYGHIIKHLEPSHLESLPVPIPREEVLQDFQKRAQAVLDGRNEAWKLQIEAEQLFEKAVSFSVPSTPTTAGFSVRSSDLIGGRRRLEAGYHSPAATEILGHFERKKLNVVHLASITRGVWWKTRFRRVFGEEGEPYLSADELFALNPDITKKVLIEQVEAPDNYRVKAGWIVMACSGQTYGLNGSVSLMTKRHESAFFSHDLVRIIPDTKNIRSGYLFTALGHPVLGRPLVIRNAYGTSIPHLDPDDVAMTPIVRLDLKIETKIADLMERAIDLRVAADASEREMTSMASDINARFLAGEGKLFQSRP
jgi:hypothetical protein